MPALLWGVAFADFVRGIPIDAAGTFTGNLLDLLVPYALLGGLMTVALFTFHGALFLTLRVDGELERRARHAALVTGPIAAVLVLVFLVWTYINAVDAHEKGIVPGIIPIAAIVLPFVAGTLARAGRNRLRVHRDRALDRARLRHAVPQPLSARARLEHRQGVQSHDLLDELDPTTRSP